TSARRTKTACSPCACSSHCPEERAHLFHELLGLLEGGEVAALVELVPVADVLEAALGPSSRRPEDLLGEDGAAHGDGDIVAVARAKALPVHAGRGRTRRRDPVEHDVVEE